MNQLLYLLTTTASRKTLTFTVAFWSDFFFSIQWLDPAPKSSERTSDFNLDDFEAWGQKSTYKYQMLWAGKVAPAAQNTYIWE